MIHLTLPVPPSVNHYWRSVTMGARRATLLSAAGRQYKRDVASICIRERVRPFPADARLSLRVVLCFGDRRRRDLSNYLKALEDALIGFVFDDDEQIDVLHISRGGIDKARPRAEISVSLHSGWSELMSETTTERVLVIRASEWLRGQGAAYSGLKSETGGRYCCLGIHGRELGLSDRELERASTPAGLAETATNIPSDYRRAWVAEIDREFVVENDLDSCFVSTADALRAMNVNDDEDIDDEERLAVLTPIFARHGIRLDFRPEE